jgi:hypothetical protein
MKINFNLDVSDEFLHDIFITANESGYSDYWAITGLIRYNRLHVAEYGDSVEMVSEKTITFPMLRQGIKRVLTRQMNNPAPYANIHSRYSGRLLAALLEQDSGQVDGELADIILQAAYFGHIVYG